MTSSPEPPPSRRRLSMDELIAILVTFASLGSVFWWAISPKDQPFDLSMFGSSTQLPSLFGSPAPLPTASPVATVPPIGTSAPNRSITTAPRGTLPSAPNLLPIVPPITPGTVPGVPFNPGTPGATPVTPASPSASPESATTATPAAPTAPTTPPPTAAPPSPTATRPAGFSDVPANFWAAPYIAGLAAKGWIEGFPNGTFQPNKPVTRAEFARLLQRPFERPKTRQALKFTDVAPNYWATSAINEAVQTGFMSGYPKGIFQPDQQIPLYQLQIALATGLGLSAVAQPESVLANYRDARVLPKWAFPKVAAAIESGIVKPNTQTLTPNQVATRADAATFIYQALAKEGKVKQR